MSKVRWMVVVGGVVLAAWGIGASGAQAASWTDFNAIIQGDLSSIGDIQGAALVGGNASGNNIFGSLGTSPGGLTLGVGGDVFGNLNLNSGNARIGGAVSGNVNNNSGGSIALGDASISDVINAVWGQATSASAAFGSLAANSTTSAQPGNKLLFQAAANAPFAVFDINVSALSSYQEFLLQRDGADTVVINVHGGAGSTVDILATMNSFTPARDSVVWNFIDADGTINVARQVEGSFLATGADLSLSAVIEGTVAARSAAMNGQEFHLPSFDGMVPTNGQIVPTPTAAALGGAGLLLIGGRRRRATV